MSLVQKIFFRSTLILLVFIVAFRIEYWPFSHYPVFADKKDSSEYVIYQFIIEKNDGSKITPLNKGLSRRVHVFMLHEEEKGVHGAGELNLKAAIHFLKSQYHGMHKVLYIDNVTNVARAYIVREHYKKSASNDYVFHDEKIIYQIDQRGFDEIFL
jgi:hypothetical protein